MMFFIIYISSASYLYSEEELQTILAVSRRNNEGSDITGVLLYHDGAIMQVLEGEEVAVTDRYQRILMDDRHRGVFKVMEGHADRRYFSDWSMGFRKLSSAQWEAVSGYKPVTSTSLQFADSSGAGKDMVGFIRSFCRINFGS